MWAGSGWQSQLPPPRPEHPTPRARCGWKPLLRRLLPGRLSTERFWAFRPQDILPFPPRQSRRGEPRLLNTRHEIHYPDTRLVIPPGTARHEIHYPDTRLVILPGTARRAIHHLRSRRAIPLRETHHVIDCPRGRRQSRAPVRIVPRLAPSPWQL